MALTEVSGIAGAPWDRPLHGQLDKLVIESEALAGNPLGDPTRRPLYVYSSPGVALGTATEVASIYVLQGFGGQLDMWLGRPVLDLSDIERLDQLWAAPAHGPASPSAGSKERCPEAVVVFIDAWTSLGGSQFLNSTATGNYSDYICDEIVPFIDDRYPTASSASQWSRRGITGKSSGGYGAMVLPMLRPGLFAALASHAGDALFEACYLTDFPKVARALRDGYGGSFERFLADYNARDRFDFERYGDILNMYAMAACYSPDPDHGGKVLLPFDVGTGRVIDDVWEQWLKLDPVRMVSTHSEALHGLERVYLGAGKSDDYFLDLGAQAVSDELTKVGVDHTLELFAGSHRGLGYRYPPAIRDLLRSL